MRSLVLTHDWSETPLGPIAAWPPSLRAAVDLILGSPLGMIILWGPELIQIYNDGYRAVMGAKHPGGLGQPTRECWPEVWHFNEPPYEAVFRGEVRAFAAAPLMLERNGFAEETRLDLTYSPLRDGPDDGHPDGRIASVLMTVVEVTERARAEAALRAGEARLAQMFEQAPTFMALLEGPEHRFVQANPGYMRLVGHRPVVGRTVAEALPEAVEQGYVDLLDRVYRTGEPFTAHGAVFAIIDLPGRPVVERHLDFGYQPLKDRYGAVTGIFVQGADVTARAEIEVALRKSEAQLRVLNADLERQVAERARERSRTWQVSPDLLGVANAEGYFESVNPGFQAALG